MTVRLHVVGCNWPTREGVLAIFTNAPSELDYEDSRQVGEFGAVRIVAVTGTERMVEAQLLRYSERGYFASIYRSDAVAFVTETQTIERSRGADRCEKWKEKGWFDLGEPRRMW